MSEATTAPILVVEDDADIRETIAAILEMEGYTVELASNG
jgi:CheY-like chemotaxis protein